MPRVCVAITNDDLHQQALSCEERVLVAHEMFPLCYHTFNVQNVHWWIGTLLWRPYLVDEGDKFRIKSRTDAESKRTHYDVAIKFYRSHVGSLQAVDEGVEVQQINCGALISGDTLCLLHRRGMCQDVK